MVPYLAGDAYRYTIQPMFENIKNEFQCHIKRRRLKILYKLFYYIMLPERKFQTPHIYKVRGFVIEYMFMSYDVKCVESHIAIIHIRLYEFIILPL